MRHGLLFGSVAWLALFTLPAEAQAQSLPEPPSTTIASETTRPSALSNAAAARSSEDGPRTERLRLTLEQLAGAYHWSALKTDLHLVVGAAFVGLAGYFAFSKNIEQGTGSSRGAAVILTMMTGSSYLGRGVYALSGTSTTHEARLARFQLRARSGPLTDAELAPFEAELALEAEIGRKTRHWEAAASLGTALGGVTLLVFGATSELRKSARHIVYIEGSVMLLSGAGLGIYSLATESSSEDEWRKYRTGSRARVGAKRRWQLAPVVSPQLAALSLVGQF